MDSTTSTDVAVDTTEQAAPSSGAEQEAPRKPFQAPTIQCEAHLVRATASHFESL